MSRNFLLIMPASANMDCPRNLPNISQSYFLKAKRGFPSKSRKIQIYLQFSSIWVLHTEGPYIAEYSHAFACTAIYSPTVCNTQISGEYGIKCIYLLILSNLHPADTSTSMMRWEVDISTLYVHGHPSQLTDRSLSRAETMRCSSKWQWMERIFSKLFQENIIIAGFAVEGPVVTLDFHNHICVCICDCICICI